MKKGHFDDLLTAVDAFKNAAGATISDIRKCLTSLGRRLAPKTVTDGLKRAIRLGFVVSTKRRYFPVSHLAQTNIVQYRRGRRQRRKRRPCPCFSKARNRTAARRSYSRRHRLGGYDGLEARRRRRRSRRRRTRRRTFDVESLERGDGIVNARRRRKRSTRRRRRGRRRDDEEDSRQKGKEACENNKQMNLIVRPIEAELAVDSESTNNQEQKIPEETVGEDERGQENIPETEIKSEKQNEDRKTGESTEETEENNEESTRSSKNKSEDQSETHSKSDIDDKEDKDRPQNECEDKETGYKSGENSLYSYTSDPKDHMETDDHDSDMYY